VKRFRNILFSTGIGENDAAMNHLVTLAIKHDASLTLMDVVKPIPRALGMLKNVADSEELQQTVVRDRREKLLKMASEYLDTGVPIDVNVSIGDPATEIVRQVLADGHDLVVRTAENVSPIGRLFGSIARSLLRICPCPVWILKPQRHGEFHRVIAAVDVEAENPTHKGLNRDILELAFLISQSEDAELHVVSAWDLWMEKSLRRRAGDAEIDLALANHEQRVHQALDEMLQVPNASIKDIHIHLRRGNAANVIRSIAEEVKADLMVMGSVCRTGAAGFLIGNTAETLLADLTCSVLALKPDGFVSPVPVAGDSAILRYARTTAK
jgi:nucleotide-binding universal stress UspA family protein